MWTQKQRIEQAAHGMQSHASDICHIEVKLQEVPTAHKQLLHLG